MQANDRIKGGIGAIGRVSANSVALALLALSISGCSTWDLACGGAPVTGDAGKRLKWETCRAHGGDKDAQYALGRRYWKGDGVARDPALAIQWLQKAAASEPKSRTYVYVPPVGSQKYGSVQGFDMPGSVGNLDAIRLLAEIKLSEAPDNMEPSAP